MTRSRRRAAVALSALAVSAAAFAGTTLTAGESAARVDDGYYTFTSNNYGVYPTVTPARIDDSVITVFTPFGVYRSRVHQTPAGGYFDHWGQRILLTRQTADSYSGRNVLGPFEVGSSSLVIRR